ncbi:MAG: SpoIID/LytB domain-containing protein, partial [Bryobacteraceae bacterium]|nr:SpoIID/LytB domain-containing protein [Bryobacteraceae bacterium]
MRWLACLLLLACAGNARDVKVMLSNGQLKTLPLEDYVAGVLMGEASVLTSPEALKAQAVASRTFAVHHLGRHTKAGYDFCEATHCQDFRLRDTVSQRVRAAVEATTSELLWSEGRPAATHYGKHCGGHSAAGSEIWPQIHAPYLRALPDTFCLIRGRSQWARELPSRVTITRKSISGRILEVLVGGQRVSAERFPSNLFELQSGGQRASGFGAGNGVGLCQVGAEERGKAGH